MDRSAQHLLPSSVKGPDRRGMIREPLDQKLGALRQAPARILLFIPVEGADICKEPAPLGFIGQQIPVQVFRIPVDQYTSQVKNDRIDHKDFFYTFLSASTALSRVSSFLAKQNRTTLSSFP